MKKNSKQRNLNKRSGFTLIEVILVIVIIGILAGIAMKGINPAGHMETANETKAQAYISTLTTAVSMYELKNGTYPETLEGLLDSSKIGYPFLSQQVIDLTPWGEPYGYLAPGSYQPYSVDIWAQSKKTGKIFNNWGQDPGAVQ